MNHSKLPSGLKIGGFGLAGLFVAFWLFMGAGEMLSGDLSGVSHLVPAALVAGAGLLAWRRLLAGGLMMLALGLAGSAYFFSLMSRPQGWITVATLVSGPVIIAGLLLVAAWFIDRPVEAGRPRH